MILAAAPSTVPGLALPGAPMVHQRHRPRGRWELPDDGPFRLLVRPFIPGNPIGSADARGPNFLLVQMLDMEMSLVKRRRYRLEALSARWTVVGAFVLCGLGAAGCGSKTACTPCMRGYYPSDPSQNCSPCKVCPETVTDASPSNIVIWCQNGMSEPDAAHGEYGVDGSEPDNAGE
jgi:hypothetical protein